MDIWACVTKTHKTMNSGRCKTNLLSVFNTFSHMLHRLVSSDIHDFVLFMISIVVQISTRRQGISGGNTE